MSKNGKKIGLALSGGGYRAAAYHIGTMRALHKLGILENIDVISSVSGGSITAAYYVQNQHKGFNYFERSFINKLKWNVLWIGFIDISFVLSICGLCLYITPGCYKIATILGLLLLLWKFWYNFFPFSKCIEWAYSLQFFKGEKLETISKYPILAINTTDLSTGNQFTFSQEKIACYPYKGKLNFTPADFPLSMAVMASSCIPQLFSPIKISSKYFSGTFDKTPILVDGGLYDNQGAHKFDSHDSHFNVDYAIVSDAGNTTISSDNCYNPIKTLVVTSDIMMKRIKNFQRQHNSYIPSDKKNVIYAYNDLMWDSYSEFIIRFVNNIKAGYIPKQVTDAHGISDDLIREMKESSSSMSAIEKVQEIIKANIGWSELLERIPKNHDVAIRVSTNLVGLSDKEINALIEHSEWMTEVQVKLHLPFLVQSKH